MFKKELVKYLFVFLFVILLSNVFVQSAPLPSSPRPQKITCTDRVAPSDDEYIRKGLMTSPISTNALGSCVPLSASLSSWWFKTECGVPFNYEFANDIHEKLYSYMDTRAFGGTYNGNAYFGLKRFLEEELPGCFSITVISCDGTMIAKARPKFNWLDPSTWTHPKRWLNPFSWFKDYRTFEFDFKNGESFNTGDTFIPRCPTKEDVEDLLRKNGDVLLTLYNDKISHTVAADGVSENNILINSNGLPAKLVVNTEDPLNVDYYDVENFLDRLRRPIGNTKNASVPFLMAVIPNKDCKIKCPSVDYVNPENSADIYNTLRENVDEQSINIPADAEVIYWNTEKDPRYSIPIKQHSTLS